MNASQNPFDPFLQPPTLPTVPRKRKSVMIILIAIASIALLLRIGVSMITSLPIPRVVPKFSVQQALENTFTKALKTDSDAKDPIAGAPVATINPFLERSDLQLAYRWNKGDTFGYEFTYEAEKQANAPNKPFKVVGDCEYVVGDENAVRDEIESSGTCFSIGPGYLATCAHVVQSAHRIQVKFGEQKFSARIVDIDYKNDLAILAYHGAIDPLALTDSSGLALAENILVLGFPISEVMGDNIKVSSGIISGIDHKAGQKAIAIDGAVNPGNSGGPVLNQNGKVVGIASATLAGKGIQPVGFACRTDDLKVLMRKNGIEPFVVKEDSTMDSKEIVRIASPSVGLIEVRGWAEQKSRKLHFTTSYSGSMQSPNVTYNGVQQHGVNGNVYVSRFGDVTRLPEHLLPYQFASIPALMIQPFDTANQDRWSMNETFALTKPSSSGYYLSILNLDNPMQSRLPDIFMGGPSKKSTADLKGICESRFEVIEQTEETVRVKRTRRFHTLDGETPSLEVNGHGEWVFDIQHGRSRSFVEDSVVIQRSNGVAKETPYSLKIFSMPTEVLAKRKQVALERKQAHDREVQAELRLPAPERITRLLEQIANESSYKRRDALSKLGKIAVVEEKREEVLNVLRKIISAKDRAYHDVGWDAYLHWANSKCAEELRRIVGKSKEHRKNALAVLMRLGLEEDAALLIEHMKDLPFGESGDLKKFGPRIEPLVLKRLTEVDDIFEQSDLLRLLEAVGTKESIQYLEKAKASVDRRTASRWEVTLHRLVQFSNRCSE
jgi:S1-C subfamily serine protease